MRFARSLGILLLTIPAAAAAGNGNRLSSDLEDRARTGRGSDLVDVIIQGEDGSLEQLAAAVSQHGGAMRRRLARGLAATLPLSSIEDLAATAGVRHISPDREVISTFDEIPAASGVPSPRLTGSTTLDGRGVGVAVIDSGIDGSDALSVTARLDFVSPRAGQSPEQSQLQDPYGHGTHVAGIIAARAEEPFGGMAPGAHLVSLRVLDSRGRGTTSDVIAALDWCIANADAHALRVVNLSLGQPAAEPADEDPLAQAVERAWRAGLVVVVSAGNAGGVGSGYGTISSPGHDPLVITVGALDDHGTASRGDDDVAAFSSRGPTRFDATVKPDLVAAGVAVASLRAAHSTLDREMPEARVPDSPTAGFFEMSGSSMAAAVVSGAAALLLQAQPGLSPDEVKGHLMTGADHLIPGGVLERGAGALDVATAMARDDEALGSPSPAIVFDQGDVSIAFDAPAWGDPAVWNLQQLYGDPSLWMEEDALTQGFLDDPCLTGDGVIWQTMTGTGIIWQTLSAEGVIWQTLTGNGVIWQTVRGKGVIWQTSACSF